MSETTRSTVAVRGTKLGKRLAELGITIPSQAAAPAGSYVSAVISGNLVFTAGQLPFVDGKLPVTGKVGGVVSPEDAQHCARTCAINALAAIATTLGTLSRVTRVVKVTGFVASDPEFSGQAGVLNGASDLLRDLFGDYGVHSRSAVGVTVLPLDSPVEVELIVEFD